MLGFLVEINICLEHCVEADDKLLEIIVRLEGSSYSRTRLEITWSGAEKKAFKSRPHAFHGVKEKHLPLPAKRNPIGFWSLPSYIVVYGTRAPQRPRIWWLRPNISYPWMYFVRKKPRWPSFQVSWDAKSNLRPHQVLESNKIAAWLLQDHVIALSISDRRASCSSAWIYSAGGF